MDERKNIPANSEQIISDPLREAMEAEARMLPSFDEVRRTAGFARSVDFLKSNNQVSYYFSFAGNKIKTFFKKVVRKLIKCVLHPIICHQNVLNMHYTEAISALYEENRAMKKELAELKEALNTIAKQ